MMNEHLLQKLSDMAEDAMRMLGSGDIASEDLTAESIDEAYGKLQDIVNKIDETLNPQDYYVD